ncbi:MAG TPA: peptidase, partial [Firmicutes bacterium]|nr:peptidase [Bacillota bacterium]
GACQSYYELLIDAGSNFASSPSRDFIHLLDPVIIATCIATSSIYETVDIEEVIEKTITKHIGGLDTRGKARKIYDGG